MSIAMSLHISPIAPLDAGDLLAHHAAAAAQTLERLFGVGFTVFDGDSGEVQHESPGLPRADWGARAELCRAASRGGRPTVIEEEPPVVALAIPLAAYRNRSLVAVGLFLTYAPESDADLARAARMFGVRCEALAAWARGHKPTSVETLERLATMAAAKLAADNRVEQLEAEVDSLSSHITSTFEEISLIYRVTQSLRISADRAELGHTVLHWLHEVVPAEGLSLLLLGDPSTRDPATVMPDECLFLSSGTCPVDESGLRQLIARFEADAVRRPVVVNRAVTRQADWPQPAVRELVLAPLAEGSRIFGWLAAFNHSQGLEFGTTEGSLLSSLGTILGIHNSNVDLYKQQADLLAGIVRAMSSAIDAKDPYTHGHSDRVARVAVRLAKELDCPQETLKAIYLSGLLHDIGKIGVDDNVLRKPGKLTEAEFQHVKTHVDIGYRILRDLRKIGHVLPVVLHHHEAWDGSGYPYGLAGASIPFMARIVAVADSYDAMSSDRPYRSGMPDEKLDAIIREGAGKQWDPAVVAAFFRARDDIREISRHQAGASEIDSLQWS